MDEQIKPVWTTSSFLVYTGGLTVLLGGLAALSYLATQFPGEGEKTAWALLILVILYAIAHGLLRRDRPLAAGIFAFVSVIAWALFVVEAFAWFGWTNGAFGDFHRWSWARLALELLVLIAAWDSRRRFRFPFIGLISAVVMWLFVIDLITGGSNFTYTVTLIVGLVYLLVGSVSDKPSAFWLHAVGGALIGVPILHWCHTTDGDFAVVLIVSLVFVVWAYWTKRSSWAVFGTIGFYAATTHYIVGSPTALAESFFGLGGGQVCTATSTLSPVCTSYGPSISPWAPALAFGLLGFWLVLLGMAGRRRHRKHSHHAPAPAAPPAA